MVAYVTMKSGDSFLGTPKEVIAQMREDCKVKSATLVGYKLGLAHRARKYYGKKVRWLDDLEFLLDLRDLGEISIMTLIEPNE